MLISHREPLIFQLYRVTTHQGR